jgi:DNA invertase Pin-like site-specific DNA recombinase
MTARPKPEAEPAPEAYSYVRFSSAGQALGDSLRRQTEKATAYCERRGWKLNAATYRDLGVSARRGKNALVGNLGEFLKAVRSGAVRPGAALVVESFDRITRQGIDEGYDLVKSILKAGVRIVTLSPEREFGVEATRSLTRGALEIQLILERAAEENERKAERVAEAQKAKRARLRERRSVETTQVPAWVKVVGDRKKVGNHMVGGTFALNPERVAVVRGIFKAAAEGLGHQRIVAGLNAAGVPPFGEHVIRPGRIRSRFTGKWTRSYVAALLRDRAVLGEFQPRGPGGAPDGPPVPGYWDAAITEGEWLAARGGAAGRFNRNTEGKEWAGAEDRLLGQLPRQEYDEVVREWRAGPGKGCDPGNRTDIARARLLTVEQAAWKLGRTRSAVRCRRAALRAKAVGRRPAARAAGRKHDLRPAVNIFTGLLRDARDGGGYFFTARTDGGGWQRVLVNSNSAEGAPCVSFPFAPFERGVLSMLREVNPGDVLPADDGACGPGDAQVLQGQLARCEAELAEANAYMDENGFSPSIGRRVTALEGQERDMRKALEEALAAAAYPASSAWGELGSLADVLDDAPDPDGVRLRLRAVLRRVIDSVWLLIVPRGRDRLCAAQVWFAGGTHRRDYLIFNRPPKSNGSARVPGGSRAGSLPDMTEAGDLRARRQARGLEQLLSALDLDALWEAVG